MTKFFDAHIRPPKGGWNYPLNGELITAYGEGELIEHIAKWQRNNGQFVSEDAIRELIWDYFCRREPDRCGMHGVAPMSEETTPVGELIPAEKTPERQGPPIWTFLNTLAAQWNPGLHHYFMATMDAIIVILECPICRDEWRKLLFQYPPDKLGTRLAVCQWVNARHNDVNARKGKQLYPYSKMVTEYGAPPQ